MIWAEAHSDDYAHEVRFDATRWFEHASTQEILALDQCGWGGDLPADAVAEDLAAAGVELPDSPSTLQALFAYLPGPLEDLSGFECHVYEEDARAWLARHRPTLLTQLDQE